MSDQNDYEVVHQNNQANAETVSPSSVGIDPPEYGNGGGTNGEIGISANGEDVTNNSVDINDPKQAPIEFERLKNQGASYRTASDIGEYLDYHPTLFSKGQGDYTYIADKDTKEPYFIGNMLSRDGAQIKYYGFSEAFTRRVVNFNNKKAAERASNNEKYIVWEDVKVTGGCTFVEGLLWGENKEPLSVSAFGLSKNLGSDEFELAFPGPSVGGLKGDLTKPFFGLEPYIRPSFNLGLFGVSFDPQKAEFTLSVGLRLKNIGADISITGKVNTNKTEAESRQYICYELLPWVGELIDALG